MALVILAIVMADPPDTVLAAASKAFVIITEFSFSANLLPATRILCSSKLKFASSSISLVILIATPYFLGLTLRLLYSTWSSGISAPSATSLTFIVLSTILFMSIELPVIWSGPIYIAAISLGINNFIDSSIKVGRIFLGISKLPSVPVPVDKYSDKYLYSIRKR